MLDDLRQPDVIARGEAWSRLERATRSTSSGLQDYRQALLESLDPEEHWAIRLQVVRLLPRLAWMPSEQAAVLAFLFAEVTRENLFIRAWALDSLSLIAVSEPAIRDRVLGLLREGLESTSAAVRVRVRHGMRRLSELGSTALS